MSSPKEPEQKEVSSKTTKQKERDVIDLTENESSQATTTTSLTRKFDSIHIKDEEKLNNQSNNDIYRNMNNIINQNLNNNIFNRNMNNIFNQNIHNQHNQNINYTNNQQNQNLNYTNNQHNQNINNQQNQNVNYTNNQQNQNINNQNNHNNNDIIGENNENKNNIKDENKSNDNKNNINLNKYDLLIKQQFIKYLPKTNDENEHILMKCFNNLMKKSHETNSIWVNLICKQGMYDILKWLQEILGFDVSFSHALVFITIMQLALDAICEMENCAPFIQEIEDDQKKKKSKLSKKELFIKYWQKYVIIKCFL